MGWYRTTSHQTRDDALWKARESARRSFTKGEGRRMKVLPSGEEVIHIRQGSGYFTFDFIIESDGKLTELSSFPDTPVEYEGEKYQSINSLVSLLYGEKRTVA